MQSLIIINIIHSYLRMEDSVNDTNQTLDLSDYEWFFISIGAVHILFVVVPVLIVGPIVLTPFVADKKLRDSVSIVFIITIIFCVFAPLVNGLLTDLSLITDIEVFGPCDTSYNIFFVLYAYGHLQVLVCNALLTVLQNVSVRHGIKKVSILQTMAVLIILFLFSIGGSLLILLTGVSHVRLRGSVCSLDGTETLIVGTILISLYVLPSIVTIGISSFLTIRFIKKNTTTKEKCIRRLIKIIVTWLVLSLIFRSFASSAPFLPLISTEISHICSFPAYYIADLNYPLFLFLSLFLHTKVNESVKRNFRKFLFWKTPANKNNTIKTVSSNASMYVNAHRR